MNRIVLALGISVCIALPPAPASATPPPPRRHPRWCSGWCGWHGPDQAAARPWSGSPHRHDPRPAHAPAPPTRPRPRPHDGAVAHPWPKPAAYPQTPPRADRGPCSRARRFGPDRGKISPARPPVPPTRGQAPWAGANRPPQAAFRSFWESARRRPHTRRKDCRARPAQARNCLPLTCTRPETTPASSPDVSQKIKSPPARP